MHKKERMAPVILECNHFIVHFMYRKINFMLKTDSRNKDEVSIRYPDKY